MFRQIERFLKDFQYSFGGVEAREAEAKVDQQEQFILPDFSDFPPEVQTLIKEADGKGNWINILINGKPHTGEPTNGLLYVKLILRQPSEQATTEFEDLVGRFGVTVNEVGWGQRLILNVKGYEGVDLNRGYTFQQEWPMSEPADLVYLARAEAGWEDQTGIARLRAVLNHSDAFELTEPVEKSVNTPQSLSSLQEMLTAIRPVTLTRSPRVEKPVNLYAPPSRSAKAKKRRISD